MTANNGWHRGQVRCEVPGCNDHSVVGFSVQLSTAGGRKHRLQVRAASVRLCMEHLNDLAKGKVPKILAASIGDAIKKVKVDE